MHEEYLFNLLEVEVIKREENQVRRLINQARFPIKKALDSFDLEQIPGLSPIKDKENVILAGNSGTGKTHLAIALGISATQLRYKVRFYTAAGLVNELTEMEGEKKLSKFQKMAQVRLNSR